MRSIDFVTKEHYKEFVAKAIDRQPYDDQARTITSLIDGRIAAVSVFSGWTSIGHAELDLASCSAAWCNRAYINAVYGIAFQHFKLRRINMVVECTNSSAVAMHEKLGHIAEGHLEDWFGEGRHATFYRYSRKDYINSRWFKWRLEQEDKGTYVIQNLEGRAI